MFARFLIFALALAVFAGLPPAASAQTVTFEDDVFPLLQVRCLECHQPGGEGFEVSGFDVSSFESLMRGTRHGPVIIPGNAYLSNLNVLVEGRSAPNLRMPHNKKPLTRCEIDILRRWVNAGARKF